MNEMIYIIDLDEKLLDCYAVLRFKGRAQELAGPLGLVVLDAQQGSITVMNVSQQDDQHLELRVRKLASQLRRPATVRAETSAERRARRARGDGVQSGQTWSPHTRRYS
jgi:hypothetical protein